MSVDASGATQVSLEYGSEETSVFDPGPTAGSASIVVGHGQSVNETALVDGLVTPGLAGDTEIQPVDEVIGWRLDEPAKAAIDRFLSETIRAPVGPEFMAPPARKMAA